MLSLESRQKEVALNTLRQTTLIELYREQVGPILIADAGPGIKYQGPLVTDLAKSSVETPKEANVRFLLKCKFSKDDHGDI